MLGCEVEGREAAIRGCSEAEAAVDQERETDVVARDRGLVERCHAGRVLVGH